MNARPLLRLSAEARVRRRIRALDQAEQAAATGRMDVCGQGDHTIAQATGLSVEQVRRVLASEESNRSNEENCHG